MPASERAWRRRGRRQPGLGCVGVLLLLGVGARAGAREYDLASTPGDRDELARLVATGELDDASAEILGRWLDEPLDLNLAGVEVLQDLPGVTRELAAGIVGWRERGGGFASVADLRAVPGLGREAFEGLVPFVTVGVSFVERADDGPVRASAEAGALWYRDEDRQEAGAAGLGFVRVLGEVEGAGAGVVLVRRRATVAHWDYSRGQLVTGGPRDALELEQFAVHLEREELRLVAGSFRLGFGERLALGVSAGREPGWATADRVTLEPTSGRVRVPDALFGAAAAVEGPELAWGRLGATVFVSRQRLPVYQYRGIDWGYDDGAGACTRTTDCRPGYACEAGSCRTTRVYDGRIAAVDPATGLPPGGLTYLTLDDAFWETLAGAHVSVAGEWQALGVTAYAGRADILLAAPAHPRFVEAAAYPTGGRFGAVGADGQVQLGDIRLVGEAAWAGDLAAVARAVMANGLGETTLAVRAYGEGFDNPRCRAEAAPDLDSGLARRNEVGARLATTLRVAKSLHTAGEMDAWRPVSGGKGWSVRAFARATLRLGDHEHLALLGRVRRSATASDGDDAPSSRWARGRTSLVLTATTTRVPALSVAATATLTQLEETGARERLGLLRLRVGATPWPGGSLMLAAAWARRLGEGERELDAAEPDVNARITLAQAVGGRLEAQARYDLAVWSGARTARRDRVHGLEVLVTAKL